jgi:hypothetical protein
MDENYRTKDDYRTILVAFVDVGLEYVRIDRAARGGRDGMRRDPRPSARTHFFHIYFDCADILRNELRKK